MIPHHRTAFRAVMLLLFIAAESNSELFKNLDFEQGRIQVPVGGVDATEVLIPGWELTFDGQVYPWMLAGLRAPGSPTAWLADSRLLPGNVIQGRFSVGLVPGFTSPSNPTEFAHWGLHQTGDIPVDTQTLRFQGMRGVFEIRVEGMNLDLVDESPADLWYAADVRQFAGRTVLLEFFTTEGSPEAGFGSHILDSIEFSPNPVIPEPSAIGVLACGVGVLLLFRRK